MNEPNLFRLNLIEFVRIHRFKIFKLVAKRTCKHGMGHRDIKKLPMMSFGPTKY